MQGARNLKSLSVFGTGGVPVVDPGGGLAEHVANMRDYGPDLENLYGFNTFDFYQGVPYLYRLYLYSLTRPDHTGKPRYGVCRRHPVKPGQTGGMIAALRAPGNTQIGANR